TNWSEDISSKDDSAGGQFDQATIYLEVHWTYYGQGTNWPAN
ncbi:971_t:CDS:1, partial [Funneliformis caledonium]